MEKVFKIVASKRKDIRMEIPLLDLKAQYQSIKTEIDETVKQVIESQYFVLSDEVKKLEEEIAKYSGVSYAAGVASGTDALILSLKALGVGLGDKVITTPFTFFATAEAVSLLGAKPIFVDINKETFNIDPDKIDELLKGMSSEERKAVKAIIPVHIYGQCADMERIMAIVDEYDIKVIEDSAQAIGAKCNEGKAGSFGDFGCFSFFPSKNLGGFGDGGMIVSESKELIDYIKVLRVHGSRQQYIHDEIAYNSRLDSLQAAILRVKLKKLDFWLDGRRRIAGKYNSALSELGVVVPFIDEGNTHTYHQYTITVENRDNMLTFLNDRKIAARIYYPVPLHLQPCYKDLGYAEGSMPISEELSKKVLSLPVYPELSDQQVEYVVETIKEFVSGE